MGFIFKQEENVPFYKHRFFKGKAFYNSKFICWVGEFFCCFFVFVCLLVWFFFFIQVAGDKKIPCNILKSDFSGTGILKCRALSCIVATDRPDVV